MTTISGVFIFTSPTDYGTTLPLFNSNTSFTGLLPILILLHILKRILLQMVYPLIFLVFLLRIV